MRHSLVPQSLKSTTGHTKTLSNDSSVNTICNPLHRRLPTILAVLESGLDAHPNALGAGGQGDVYEAVDINTGEHYACKVVAFKGPIPQWNIKKESEFKRRIRDEVEIVEKASHVSSPRLPALWLASC